MHNRMKIEYNEAKAIISTKDPYKINKSKVVKMHFLNLHHN